MVNCPDQFRTIDCRGMLRYNGHMETEENNRVDLTEVSSLELGRALAARKKRASGECVVCSKPIEGVIKQGEIARLYCSERCRKAAYRARKKVAPLQLAGEA